MDRRLSSLALTVALSTGMIVGFTPSAAACSCALGSVAQKVAVSESVYVAEARAFDLLPGKSFRVVRVLKGPAKSNLRVKKIRGCGQISITGTFVLTGKADGSIHALSGCSEYLKGDSAVREAESVLGRGEPAPRRLDWSYIGPWLGAGPLALATMVVAFLLWRRRQRWLDGL